MENPPTIGGAGRPRLRAASAESLNGAASARITSALVSLRKRYTGKGPPRARTYMVEDLVVCVSSEWLTVQEKNLRDIGKEEQVRHVREWIHRRMRQEAVRAVESITGRRVGSLMSQLDVDRDLQIDSFLLEP
ncbi:MAG: hypothetical protein AUG48_04010 [Actinobacteria bacterium 13_1_20CM_3_68_9]|nr:MAG: hypothetical protein AUG48_04010 [Actinobacteria bacterium 13_1_20CM_3_68_9]